MKEFLGNRVEDAAMGFINVLNKDYYHCEDASIVEAFLEKLIADEKHHVKLLREALGEKPSKGVTVIIK